MKRRRGSGSQLRGNLSQGGGPSDGDGRRGPGSVVDRWRGGLGRHGPAVLPGQRADRGCLSSAGTRWPGVGGVAGQKPSRLPEATAPFGPSASPVCNPRTLALGNDTLPAASRRYGRPRTCATTAAPAAPPLGLGQPGNVRLTRPASSSSRSSSRTSPLLR